MFPSKFNTVWEVADLKRKAMTVATSDNPFWTQEEKIIFVKEWLIALHGNVGAAPREKCVEYIDKWNAELMKTPKVQGLMRCGVWYHLFYEEYDMKTKYLRVFGPVDVDISNEMMRYSGARVYRAEGDNCVLIHNTATFAEMCQRRWQSFGVKTELVKKPK